MKDDKYYIEYAKELSKEANMELEKYEENNG